MSMTTTPIPTEDVIDMIEDILNDLDLFVGDPIYQHTESTLLRWINDLRDKHDVPVGRSLPDAIADAYVAQAIADIIAKRINRADEELVDAAMQDMMTDEGWRFEQWNMTLWVECSNDHDTLVVWLGNEIDFDMARIGRAKIAN
jgi:hypothetical protein